MKEFLGKHKLKIVLCIITGLVLVFGVPIVINWAYEQPAILPAFAMSWDAKDALGFYGALLGSGVGAFATIFVLYRTIQFTVDNQKEERRMAVRPYLETRKYQYTDLKKVENRGNTWFLDVKNGKTTYQAEIPEEIQEIKKRIQRMENGPNANPYLEVSADYASDSYLANHYLLEIEICNCGAGNAIDVEFEMNGHSLAPIFCITTDLPKKFICILNEDLLVNGEYEMLLSYKYGDISSSAKYVQKEKVIFYRDNSNELSTKQYKSDYLTRPVEITDVKS